MFSLEGDCFSLIQVRVISLFFHWILIFICACECLQKYKHRFCSLSMQWKQLYNHSSYAEATKNDRRTTPKTSLGKQASVARAMEECRQSLIRNFLMQECLKRTLFTGASCMPERLLEIASFVLKGIDGQRLISHCSDPSCGCWDISADTKPRAGKTGTTPFLWANGEESGLGNRRQIWLLNGDLGGQRVFELCMVFFSVMVAKRKLGTRDTCSMSLPFTG